MQDCPLLKGCCFFNDICENMPASSEFMKSEFCRGKYEACARYFVYRRTDGKGVPSYLFPNEMEKTARIIREYEDYQKR